MSPSASLSVPSLHSAGVFSAGGVLQTTKILQSGSSQSMSPSPSLSILSWQAINVFSSPSSPFWQKENSAHPGSSQSILPLLSLSRPSWQRVSVFSAATGMLSVLVSSPHPANIAASVAAVTAQITRSEFMVFLLRSGKLQRIYEIYNIVHRFRAEL